MCPREEVLCCSSEGGQDGDWTSVRAGRMGGTCESQESRVLSHLCIFWITEGTGKDSELHCSLSVDLGLARASMHA